MGGCSSVRLGRFGRHDLLRAGFIAADAANSPRTDLANAYAGRNPNGRKPLSFSTGLTFPNDAQNSRQFPLGKQHALGVRAPETVLSCERARADAYLLNIERWPVHRSSKSSACRRCKSLEDCRLIHGLAKRYWSPKTKELSQKV